MVVPEILIIPDAVIGESALPDFSRPADDPPEGVRISTLDRFNGMFDGDAVCWSEQEMDVFRHHNECVKLEASFAAISVKGFQEKSDTVLDNEESTALPSRERDEVSSGRR